MDCHFLWDCLDYWTDEQEDMKKLLLISLLFLVGCMDHDSYVGIQVQHMTSLECGIVQSWEISTEHNNQVIYTIEIFNPFNGKKTGDVEKWMHKEWNRVATSQIDDLIMKTNKMNALKKKYEE